MTGHLVQAQRDSTGEAGDRGAGSSDWLAGTIKRANTPSRRHSQSVLPNVLSFGGGRGGRHAPRVVVRRIGHAFAATVLLRRDGGKERLQIVSDWNADEFCAQRVNLALRARMIDAPELSYSDPAYVEMWDRVAADWRDRNSFRHLRDCGRSRSTVEAFETLTVFIGKPATDRTLAASQRVSALALSLAWSADYGQ